MRWAGDKSFITLVNIGMNHSPGYCGKRILYNLFHACFEASSTTPATKFTAPPTWLVTAAELWSDQTAFRVSTQGLFTSHMPRPKYLHILNQLPSSSLFQRQQFKVALASVLIMKSLERLVMTHIKKTFWTSLNGQTHQAIHLKLTHLTKHYA